MARALRFQLHDRLAATVASPRIRSGRGRPLCSGWVIRLETKAGWVGLVPRALTRCPRERRRSESNRRIEVLQTSALPLGYGARGLGKCPQLGRFSTHRRACRVCRRRLLAILLALQVIHAPEPAARSEASVAPTYSPAARASVSTTAMFGNSPWGTPCRSCRYAGLL